MNYHWHPDLRGLVRVGGRTVRRMTPAQFPDNDREFIVDQLFWGQPEKVEHWRLEPGPGCAEARWAHGYALTSCWRAARAGASLSWLGFVEADLVGFHQLKLRVQAARSSAVSVEAEIDGRWVSVAGPERGVDDFGEIAGPIDGRSLTAVRVTIEAGGPGELSNSVMWVMLVRPGEPTPLPRPDPAWPELLAPTIGDNPRPHLGLFFPPENLDDLRRRLHEPPLSQAWDRQIDHAQDVATRFARIEEHAGPYVPQGTNRYGRPRCSDEWFFHHPATIAFVGLIECRGDLLQLAARWALTWSLCKRWVCYGIEALEGVEMSHGRFTQSYMAMTLSLVLDWAGDALTAHGRSAVARAIHDKGMLDIDGLMHRDSYVWGMNQGIVYELGRFAGACATRQWYPDEFARRRDEAQEMLEVCLTRSFAPDGACREGTAYWNNIAADAMPLAHLLAQASGTGLADVMPAVMAASGRWALANLRSDTREGLLLQHGDSGFDRPLTPTMCAFFAGPLGMAEFWEPARASYPASTDPLYLHWMSQLPNARPATPARRTLSVFADAGQVDIRQSNWLEGMRVYFLSGSRDGHCHDDKNSFMLEAYGQSLLIDRGTPAYTHPQTPFCKSTGAHNALAPDGLTQTALAGEPSATLLGARESGPWVIVESDAAAAWRGIARRWLRRLIHLRPATLLVEDIVEWTEPRETHLYWQCPQAWSHCDDAWHARAGPVELRLSLLTGGDIPAQSEPCSIDALLRPVHRLGFTLPRSTSARVVTLIQTRPDASSAWPTVVRYDPTCDQAVMTTPAGCVHTLRWSGGNVLFDA